MRQLETFRITVPPGLPAHRYARSPYAARAGVSRELRRCDARLPTAATITATISSTASSTVTDSGHIALTIAVSLLAGRGAHGLHIRGSHGWDLPRDSWSNLYRSAGVSTERPVWHDLVHLPPRQHAMVSNAHAVHMHALAGPIETC